MEAEISARHLYSRPEGAVYQGITSTRVQERMGVVSTSSMWGSCRLVCPEWLRDLLAVFLAGGSQLRFRDVQT